LATADEEADLPFMAGDEGRLESDCSSVTSVVEVEWGDIGRVQVRKYETGK